MRLLIFGPPASGKGTQADWLSQRLGIPPVATGNILRAQVALRTQLGLRAQALMERGDLVPDDLMIDLVRSRLQQPDCTAGFLLDGFPRTVPQARALDALVESMDIRFDRVLYLTVPVSELVRRISGRLTCAICGRSYYFPPGKAHPDACGADGALLFVREDDKPETARRRVSVYLERTLPVIDHYRRQGLVTEIDGVGAVEEVSSRLLRGLSPDGSSHMS